MSAPTEDRGQLWHPTLGDLALWYPTFELYAASTPANNVHFHDAHVAAPVELTQVREALQRFEEKYGEVLRSRPLPDLRLMEIALRTRGTGDQLHGEREVGHHEHVHGGHGQGNHVAIGGIDLGTADEGSPCHNFWHWLHGTS